MADTVNPTSCYKYANGMCLARGGLFNMEHTDAWLVYSI